MKKMFTLFAVIAMAMTAGAQTITFGEEAVAAPLATTTWENGGVKLVLTNDGKPAIDLNNAAFGTADENVKFVSRLKTGGKSGSNRFLTLTVPADGTVRVAARTGKNTDNTRTLVLSQNDKELVNQALDETNAITVDENKIYPYVSAEVKKGDVVITFPVNGINIYGIEFVAAATTAIHGIGHTTSKNDSNTLFNLAGQRVSKSFKGVVIKDGKKIVQK